MKRMIVTSSGFNEDFNYKASLTKIRNWVKDKLNSVGTSEFRFDYVLETVEYQLSYMRKCRDQFDRYDVFEDCISELEDYYPEVYKMLIEEGIIKEDMI